MEMEAWRFLFDMTLIELLCLLDSSSLSPHLISSRALLRTDAKLLVWRILIFLSDLLFFSVILLL